MLLFVGLGNPGERNAGHRHNVGYMAVDEIVRRHCFSRARKKFHGLLSEGTLAGEKLMLLKPTTYVNDSGRAVRAALDFHKLEATDVVVFHDELDLAAGKIRVKRGGGLAGHNGLKSIAAHIGPDFRRVRIGISHPGEKSRVHNHVLGNFAKGDRTWLQPILEAIAAAADDLTRDDDNAFSTRVALLLNPPETKQGAKQTTREGPKDGPEGLDLG